MNLTKTELEEKIRAANQAYWVDNDPQISDQEYDELVEELRKIDPENELVDGFFIPTSNLKKKVIHKKPMLSLKKAYSLEEVKAWAKGLGIKNPKLLLQPKYDGMSGKWEDKVLSSRGSGTVGEDYTDKLPIVTFLGGKKTDDKIIGEIVITDEDWKWMQEHDVKGKSGKPFKNQRNAIAGIIGTDDAAKIYKDVNAKMRKEGHALITFVKYGVHSWETTLDKIDEVWGETVEKIKNLGYPIDGIVIKLADEEYAESLGATDHYPRGAIAFKFSNKAVWSKLIGIQWTMGKQQIAAIGNIEAVDISGTTVKNVKLQLTAPKSSAVTTYLLDGSLQIGDEVLVEKAGDIIPHIAASKPGKHRIKVALTQCPFCNGPLEITETSVICTNPHCRRKEIEKLMFAMVTLGFKGVGEKYAELLHDVLNVKTVDDLLSVSEMQLRKHSGFGNKMVDVFMEEQAKAKDAGFQKILVAMDLPSIGKNVAKLLEENFEKMDIISCNFTKNDLLKVHGIGNIAAEEIIEGLQDRHDEVMTTVLKYVKNLTEDINAPKNDEEWPDICFTGKMSRPRSEMEQLARDNNMIAMGDVTSKTKFLVCADPSSNSGKMKKARKLGCKVISEAEFFEMIKK